MKYTKQLYSIAAVVWMAFIFIFSGEERTTSSGRSDQIISYLKQSGVPILENIKTFFVRKLAHFGLYFVLGILVWNVVRGYSMTRRMVALLSVLGCALYAVSDEVHQLFSYGRSAEVRDVVIDSVAAALGVFVCHWIQKRKS
jgi:VanZ family protein